MKKLILAIILCFISVSASAKVTYGGHPFMGIHIDTLKGHLYHAAHIAKNKRMKQTLADTVAWLDIKHKSKKVFEIGDDHSVESQIIQGAVGFFREIEKGLVPELDASMLERWYFLGMRVSAKKVNGKWVLDLKEK
tara:strand:- start:3008 stop:3415 length:408 start_codon:yes stop_codon:yes gene_type:complete